jgi:hypothetical protein
VKFSYRALLASAAVAVAVAGAAEVTTATAWASTSRPPVDAVPPGQGKLAGKRSVLLGAGGGDVIENGPLAEVRRCWNRGISCYRNAR